MFFYQFFHYKGTLNENLKNGQIEDKEYTFFKKNIDQSVKMLSDFVPDWNLPLAKDFLKSVPFFTFLDEKTLDALLLESKEYEFEKDFKITTVKN